MNGIIVVFALFVGLLARSQGSDWHKDVEGKLFPVTGKSVQGLKADEIFKIINRIPAISDPKGFNVKEWFETSMDGKTYSARLYVNFYQYYSFDKGPVQLQTSHPYSISIYVNEPKQLMNEQSILFGQEAIQLKSPVMFSDTFGLDYKNTNGYNVGHGINTEFESNIPIYVLNPGGLSFFRPITQEEYLRFFIGKLGLDIEKDQKQMDANKSDLANNPLMKSSLPEFEIGQSLLKKWIEFLKQKKQYYEKKLSAFTPAEKKAPASCALHLQSAQLIDENGNYVEHLSGHIPYEPAEEGTDAFKVIPLYTFKKDPFDTKFPKTSFQIIVIKEGFRVDEVNEIKSFLSEQFYPLLSYKDLAVLMFK